MNIFALEASFYAVLALAMLAVKIYAFVSALMFSGESYDAANKLTKPAWGAILGIGVAVQLILGGSPIGILNLAFLIAAFVYLADVRPALRSLRRR